MPITVLDGDRLRSGWPALINVVLAAALAGFVLATIVEAEDGWPGAAQVFLAILAVAPLALLFRAPVTATLVMMAAVEAYALLGYGYVVIGGNGVVLGVFVIAASRPPRVSVLMLLAALGGVVTLTATARDTLNWPDSARAALVLAVAWAIGERLKHWSARMKAVAVRAAEQATRERLHLARELHDIVGHHISVITLHAGLAEYVLAEDPAGARASIGIVASAGRGALTEMRQLLDVLRDDQDSDDPHGRPPGLTDVPALVDRARGTGLAITLTTTGDVRPLPGQLELCAYRVVQEALTNVLKHAGLVDVRVEVDYGPRNLRVTVSDNGDKPSANVAGSTDRHGLRGMRERAELHGGTLDFGVSPAGGFRVHLRLPVKEQR